MGKSSPDRRAINEHMHRDHGGAALAGGTLSRFVQHDLLHAEDPRGLAGKPLHSHLVASDNASSLAMILPDGVE